MATESLVEYAITKNGDNAEDDSNSDRNPSPFPNGTAELNSNLKPSNSFVTEAHSDDSPSKRDKKGSTKKYRKRRSRGSSAGSSRSRSRERSRSRSRSRRGRDYGGKSRSERRRQSYSRSPSPEGYRIHISDLADVTKADLEETFGKFGSMLEIWIAHHPPCFAFVVYRKKEDGLQAIKEMDGAVLGGGRIRVSEARPRTRGRGRRNFDPNMRCYQCGERGHFSRDCETQKYGFRRPRSRSYSRSPIRRSGRSVTPRNRSRRHTRSRS